MSSTSSKMNPSKDHNNWITIGEVINLIKKPVALYTNQIIQNWCVRLSKDCLPFGLCPNPGYCKTKTKPNDLCLSCNGWYKELVKSHRNNKKEWDIKWHDNCNTSEWPVDPWEVAKFFMPILGGNKETTKDAESTDLSSLLNVLIWMKDLAFAPDRRVDLDLTKKLRSEVRNPWAHAPNQEFSDVDLNHAFDIANEFVADLDKIFDCDEVKQCVEEIKFLQSNELTNIVQAEFKALILLRKELVADANQMNEEIRKLKEDQSSDRQVIKENRKELQELEERVSQLPSIVNVQQTEPRFQLKNCIPDRPGTFIGRDAEVKQIVSSLVEDSIGIFSIVGGPGFGKSTVAIEVCHHLSNNHDIIVIFSLLSNVSTVPEVILSLCRDAGVYPGDDPVSSLMFLFRSLERKVVIVLDNIEQLVDSNVESRFSELLVTLRKSSRQQLQILTTTRKLFSISDKNVEIKELDEKSSVELLGKYCCEKEVKSGCLPELANLCGFHPLALGIAGSQIPHLDNLAELIIWLRDTPMDVLDKCSQAIEFSFKKLNDEDRKALVRLSVFQGNFQRNSAEEVIERRMFKAHCFLKNLVDRNLIQSSSNKRFVIHSLIRRFLADHDQLQDEKTIAKGLMVKHFLKMCHLWTVDSYSKDRFTAARELLIEDAHNVEKTLKLCSQDETNPKAKIVEFLTSSDIYNSSSRYFYDFCWDLLQLSALRNFHESCQKLAEGRTEIAIRITFQCLIADAEGRISAWNSPEYIGRMESIKEAYDSNKAILKEDRSLLNYCYYFYARYYSKQATNTPCPDLLEDDLVPLSQTKSPRSTMENAGEVRILIRRAELNKRRATKAFHSDREKYMKCAESFYNEALSSANERLGDHDITSVCYKGLGDLYFTWQKNTEALRYYSDAIKLRKKLKLGSNESFVYLLKNYGSCLYFLSRFDESMGTLNDACDIADKLGNQSTHCRASVYEQRSIICSAWKPDCREAADHAKAAMEMKKFLDPHSLQKLESIIKTAEENLEEENDITQLKNSQLKSRIPDKPPKFIGRDTEVKQIISFLENGHRIVSIVGRPGFGKTTVAVKVSHDLIKKPDTIVIFSFLSNVSTIPDVILSLCRDAGVNPGDDPELSLMFFLINLGKIKKKVVLVMDNIEQLLESNVESQFTELLVKLSNNSRQQLQILTTTRKVFSTAGLTTKNVEIKELDEKSSVELLGKYCCEKEVKSGRLPELANLCGFHPLALGIVGTRISVLDNLTELIKWLRETPMDVLDECSQAIEFSFKKLSDEDKKALVRLSVFHGNFQRNSAEEVIERKGSKAQRFFMNLVHRNLIQSSCNGRFVIHSLIRRFLADHDQLQDEKAIAKGLMVKHFLKMCHLWTVDSYSKDGFTAARELLMEDAHNVEESLKLCSQEETNPKAKIVEFLTSSDIYKSSSRYFYDFCSDLLQLSPLRNFYESCQKLAEGRKEIAIQITFQCLIADAEGRISSWKSTEYRNRMEAIKKVYDSNKTVLNKDRSLLSYCYYFYARYQVENRRYHADQPEDDFVSLSENNTRNLLENADRILTLMQRAHLSKKNSMKLFQTNEEKSKGYMECAKSFYKEALSLAEESLGNHKLTFFCNRSLGDLYSALLKSYNEASLYYIHAIKLGKKLQLDSNERFVYLLKSDALCRSFLRRFDESVKELHEALEIADKFGKYHGFCKVNVYFALARVYRAWKPDCQKATVYAKAAMQKQVFDKRELDKQSVERLQDIVRTAANKKHHVKKA